jgi:hypothetical protein
MKKHLKKFIAECIVCQQNHYEATLPPILLQPNLISTGAWQDMSMDFVEGLPKSDGKSFILVVIDIFTKYAHFVPLSHPYTTKVVAENFIQHVFKLHGLPKIIITDRDPVFLSSFWDAFFTTQGTKLCKCTAYHPQTDGQTENLNRTLEQYLRCVLSEKQGNWIKLLPWAEWWYNTTYHPAIKMSPFQALYGYQAPSVSHYIPGTTVVDQVDRDLKDRDALLAELKHNLQLTQSRMKRFYDRKHKEREFVVRDRVFLKLQKYKQFSVEKRDCTKLKGIIPCGIVNLQLYYSNRATRDE